MDDGGPAIAAIQTNMTFFGKPFRYKPERAISFGLSICIKMIGSTVAVEAVRTQQSSGFCSSDGIRMGWNRLVLRRGLRAEEETGQKGQTEGEQQEDWLLKKG